MQKGYFSMVESEWLNWSLVQFHLKGTCDSKLVVFSSVNDLMGVVEHVPVLQIELQIGIPYPEDRHYVRGF